jgi:hypothetical protein
LLDIPGGGVDEIGDPKEDLPWISSCNTTYTSGQSTALKYKHK